MALHVAPALRAREDAMTVAGILPAGFNSVGLQVQKAIEAVNGGRQTIGITFNFNGTQSSY